MCLSESRTRISCPATSGASGRVARLSRLIRWINFLSLGQTASDFIPRSVFIPHDRWGGGVRLILARVQHFSC